MDLLFVLRESQQCTDLNFETVKLVTIKTNIQNIWKRTDGIS